MPAVSQQRQTTASQRLPNHPAIHRPRPNPAHRVMLMSLWFTMSSSAAAMHRKSRAAQPRGPDTSTNTTIVTHCRRAGRGTDGGAAVIEAMGARQSGT